MKPIEIGTDALSIYDVALVAREYAPVSISQKAFEPIKKSRAFVEQCVSENKIIYGITTGFGKLADTFIPANQSKALQKNLLLSHAIGVGEPFPKEVVRGMLCLRLHSLAKGFSGVRPIILDYLVRFLNEDLSPLVPSQGSVGSSGDLAPLAHLALPLIGEGRVEWKGSVLDAKEGLSHLKLQPLELEAKEGVGLINGTQAMTSLATLSLVDIENLLNVSFISSAMTLEATLSSDRFLDDKLHQLRPHPGQLEVAKKLREMVRDSQLTASHKKSLHRIQDAYSLRCIPQVHGGVHDAFHYTKKVIEVEINSVTDNPLVFAEHKEILSGGNFHGHPVALVLDFLKVALTSLSNITERRIERLVNSALNEGLPPFLTEHSGTHSGMMIAQYTAAALVSENKILSHPASVDSISTSANQEDYNSMGTIAARNLAKIVENTRTILAIELMCATQALEFRRPLTFGVGVEAAYKTIRNRVPRLSEDRLMGNDLSELIQLIRSGELVQSVEAAI